jgi:O-antigen chain-terminating methyltransferase
MNQNASIEDVMERIRARVMERDASSISSSDITQSATSEADGRVADAAQREVAARLEIEANDLSPLRREIDTALEGTRLVGQINPRNPGLLNSLVQFVKKVMRRSLTWYTRPLHYFQGGAIRALQRTESILQNHDRSLQRVSGELGNQAAMLEHNAEDISRQGDVLSNDVVALKERIAELSEKIAAMELNAVSHAQIQEESMSRLRLAVMTLTERADEFDQLARTHAEQEQKLASHGERLASVAGDLASLRSAYGQMAESFRHFQLQGRKRDRDIRRFIHDVRSGEIDASGQQQSATVPPMFPAGLKRESDFDYFAFEDLYRGDEDLIRHRQKEYLEYFRGRNNVLDVGCGRGEFLELLREHNISAKGVELGTDQYLLCKEKGLDVIQQDLFSYLESIPDESLEGLFSAQVIEHMTASDQLRYVGLAYQKTSQGSPVIFETINAQCVWAIVRSFFLDPTHVRPIHPETLKFAMESVNFKNVELRFSSPASDRFIPPLVLNGDVRNLSEFNQRVQDLNDLLYGNQDYAAIGWR